MLDNGVVVATEEDLARVRVDCFSGCRDCTAHGLCIGGKSKSGVLAARNPIGALRGDRVSISVPEDRYSRALIVIFGSLLAAVLAGGAGGYALGPLFSLSSALGGALGLLAALLISGWWLSRHFRKADKAALYPVITEIIQKGAL
jgi:positive regulator of sigma E activity